MDGLGVCGFELTATPFVAAPSGAGWCLGRVCTCAVEASALQARYRPRIDRQFPENGECSCLCWQFDASLWSACCFALARGLGGQSGRPFQPPLPGLRATFQKLPRCPVPCPTPIRREHGLKRFC